MTMKLYIWENDGISDAYHDNGTLVVLAETAEEARAIVRAEKKAAKRKEIADDRRAAAWSAKANAAYEAQVKAWADARHPNATGTPAYIWLNRTPEGQAWQKAHPHPGYGQYDGWDGSDKALDREPDRIVSLDKPCVVAFNGGGYD